MIEQEIKELERKHHAECIDDASRNDLPISDSQVKRFADQGITLVKLYEILIQRKSIEMTIDYWFELLENNGIIKTVSAWQYCTRKYTSVIIPTQYSTSRGLFKVNRETLLTPEGVREVINLI